MENHQQNQKEIDNLLKRLSELCVFRVKRKVDEHYGEGRYEFEFVPKEDKIDDKFNSTICYLTWERRGHTEFAKDFILDEDCIVVFSLKDDWKIPKKSQNKSESDSDSDEYCFVDFKKI